MAINSLNSVSHGLSGLVSGMDTQSMVDSMLAGTQAKIDKQKANKTILGYKRETYRDTISSLKAFQQNFFSFSGSNSMLSSSFYNTMATSSLSKAFKVKAGSSAITGKTTVNSIEQLAQSLKMKSKLAETTAAVEGELDLSKLKPEGSEIQLELDGIIKTIKLPQITDKTPLAPGVTKEQEFVNQLNATIKQTFGNGVTASLSGSKISFTAGTATDTSREFKIIGNADAMGALGMQTGISNKINTRMNLQNINFAEPLSGDSFKFKINGVEFAINATDSLDTVISRINNSDANVKVRYSSIEDKFSIESTVSGEGTSITMSQSEGNLLSSMFGIGSSSSVTGKTQYAYSNMTGKIPGMTDDITDQAAIDELVAKLNTNLKDYLGDSKGYFTLNVDGKEIKVEVPTKDKETYTVEDVIKAIDENAELDAKGIKLSLDIANSQFTGGITLTANDGVKIEAGTGMSLLGIKGSNEKVATENTTLAQMGITQQITMTIGATELKFAPTRTLDFVTKAIQKELQAQATAEGQTAEQVGAIKVEVLKAPPGSEGKIRLFGVDIPTEIHILGDDKKLFGTDTISLSSGNNADGSNPNVDGNIENIMDTVTKGQNAIAYINGERVERNSNEFTVGGMSFELKETFNVTYAKDKESGTVDTTKFETIDVSRDTDKMYDGIVKFMDEYNKIVEKTWSLLKAKTTFKDYPPLTDKQKESMSEKEVELWDKKSQEGLMRSDEKMTAIMDTMRQVLNRRPEGSKYSLADMGITTGYDMETGIGGKLIFNDGVSDAPGTRLRKMISEEPEAMEKLFSDSKTGLLTELNSVLDGATTKGNAASGVKGKKYGNLSLVDVAGSPTMIDTSSKIYNETRNIDKNLESLKRKYEAEYSRYWKQFNAMEQMVQQMNQQSSWLTQQLGG